MLKIRFCQRRLVRRQCVVTCPATTEQNNGDKSRENGPGKISTFLLRHLLTRVMAREFPLARLLGCRPCRSLPSGSILRLCVCFPPVRNLCNLWTLWFPNSKIRSFKLSKKLSRKVFSKPSVSSRVRRTHTLLSWVASACSTCV